MTTVYHFNNIYIAKDLIFGWVISDSGERGKYFPINAFDIKFLNVLYEAPYPAYMPREFKQSLYEEIQARKLMTESVKESTVTTATPQVLDRTKDKYMLLCDIMGKLSVIGDQSCADLGYLIFYLIQKQTTEYEIVYRVPGKPDHHERFKDLDVCLAYILKRWW